VLAQRWCAAELQVCISKSLIACPRGRHLSKSHCTASPTLRQRLPSTVVGMSSAPSLTGRQQLCAIAEGSALAAPIQGLLLVEVDRVIARDAPA
jgi:hypothetical protein